MVSNKLVLQHFVSSKGAHMFECRYSGTTRKLAASCGHTNLVGHLADKHPHYVDDYAEYEHRGSLPLDRFGFVTDKAATIHSWMSWVVGRDMPVSATTRRRV